ncbi:MAG: hypothetical protein ACR2NN_11265 [Bryobacteraceae bacterium]
MGQHYVNGDLVADGEIDASKPEALIYEPSQGGLQLVGVEFVVIAETWLRITAARRCSRARPSNTLAARTGTACPHTSSCTSGLGGTTHTAPSWTGIAA